MKVKSVGKRAAKKAVWNSLLGSLCILDYDFHDHYHYPREDDYNWDGEYIPQELSEACVREVMVELERKAGVA